MLYAKTSKMTRNANQHVVTSRYILILKKISRKGTNYNIYNLQGRKHLVK